MEEPVFIWYSPKLTIDIVPTLSHLTVEKAVLSVTVPLGWRVLFSEDDWEEPSVAYKSRFVMGVSFFK